MEGWNRSRREKEIAEQMCLGCGERKREAVGAQNRKRRHWSVWGARRGGEEKEV